MSDSIKEKEALLEYDADSQRGWPVRDRLGSRAIALMVKKKLIENIQVKGALIENMCNELGLSRSHCIRSFKATFNETPLAFLIRNRIELAKKLIVENVDAPFKQIADMCGFGSIYHFSKVFKDVVGVNPSEFFENSIDAKMMQDFKFKDMDQMTDQLKADTIKKIINSKPQKDILKELDAIASYNGKNINFIKSRARRLRNMVANANFFPCGTRS
jgi:AraC-like DNA-binding protein